MAIQSLLAMSDLPLSMGAGFIPAEPVIMKKPDSTFSPKAQRIIVALQARIIELTSQRSDLLNSIDRLNDPNIAWSLSIKSATKIAKQIRDCHE